MIKTTKEKKSIWISIYKHPKDNEIEIELGKINASEMIYNFDEKKKEFIEIGYPHLLEYVRLPRLMNHNEMTEWIGTQEEIRKKCDKYSKKTK